MSYTIANYDGGFTTWPEQLVVVETVEEIQALLKDPQRSPSPGQAKFQRTAKNKKFTRTREDWLVCLKFPAG